MGRPRKPIEMQAGNITVLEKEKRKLEEQYIRTGKNQLSKPPVWLINDVAKKEFKRLVKELKNIEIIGNLDLDNLGCYCNAFANYIQVTEELKEQPYTIERETKHGTMLVKNPLIDVQTNYANEMRRFAALCGLTMDSRLKMAPAKTEKVENEIKTKFGDI